MMTEVHRVDRNAVMMDFLARLDTHSLEASGKS
jgi:hypothetical protein